MARGIRAVAVAAALVAIAACSSPSSQPTSPPPPLAPPSDPADTTVPPEPAESPAPAQPSDAGSPVAADVRPEGAACSSGAECESGVCEGEGCGPDEGRCAAKMRACTRDLRPYCGCDGETFRTSGSCPGRVYAHRGECRQ